MVIHVDFDLGPYLSVLTLRDHTEEVENVRCSCPKIEKGYDMADSDHLSNMTEEGKALDTQAPKNGAVVGELGMRCPLCLFGDQSRELVVLYHFSVIGMYLPVL